MPTLKDQTATDSAAGRDTENCQGNGVAPPIQILKDQTINDANVRSSTFYSIHDFYGNVPHFTRSLLNNQQFSSVFIQKFPVTFTCFWSLPGNK